MRITSFRDGQTEPAPSVMTCMGAGNPTLLSSGIDPRQAGVEPNLQEQSASARGQERPIRFRRARLLRLRSKDGALLSVRVPVIGRNRRLLRIVRAAEQEAWDALECWEE